MLKIGAPVMLLALIVGLAIALFQELTSIQEMTLTFVPKIIVIFVGIMLMLPFKIGRASCRERVFQYVSISVVAGYLKTQNAHVENAQQNTDTNYIMNKNRIKHNY